MKFLGCIWYETKFGKEKDSLEELSKKVNLMSEILARPVLKHLMLVTCSVHSVEMLLA